jgi:hypothetical protein
MQLGGLPPGLLQQMQMPQQLQMPQPMQLQMPQQVQMLVSQAQVRMSRFFF